MNLCANIKKKSFFSLLKWKKSNIVFLFFRNSKKLF